MPLIVKSVNKDMLRHCPYCQSRQSTLMFYDQMILKGDALNTGQWPADCGCGGKWTVEEDDNGARQIFEDEPPTGTIRQPNRDS